MLEFSHAATLVVAVLLVGFGVLSVRLDRRERRSFDVELRRAAFHCIRCDSLYTARVGRDLCPCPQCGHENTRLRY
jgi:Zn finger protein HypA/HybF involved in hydrogenase expression